MSYRFNKEKYFASQREIYKPQYECSNEVSIHRLNIEKWLDFVELNTTEGAQLDEDSDIDKSLIIAEIEDIWDPREDYEIVTSNSYYTNEEEEYEEEEEAEEDNDIEMAQIENITDINYGVLNKKYNPDNIKKFGKSTMNTTMSNIGMDLYSKFRKLKLQEFNEKDEINRNLQNKDFTTDENGIRIFRGRLLQNHIIYKWEKKRYESFGYTIYKNFECPSSNVSELNSFNEDNYENKKKIILSYRYIRYKDNGIVKEIMCRYCYGKNWILREKYFEHLFWAHGVITYFNTNMISQDYLKHETYSIEGNKDQIKRVIVTQKLLISLGGLNDGFCQIIQALCAELIPMPDTYKNIVTITELGSVSLQQVQVVCKTCNMEINLLDSTKTGKNLSGLHDKLEGLYENYMVHYVEHHIPAQFLSKQPVYITLTY